LGSAPKLLTSQPSSEQRSDSCNLLVLLTEAVPEAVHCELNLSLAGHQGHTTICVSMTSPAHLHSWNANCFNHQE